MSTTPAPLISSLDSFYMYVQKQMGVVNPARVASMLGMAEATDWPQIEAVDGGIYLLHVGSSPVKSRQSTEACTYFEHIVQWVWLLIGTDVQPDQVGANRGDRYRKSVDIFDDLNHAHYPGFCGKAVVTADTQGNVSAVVTDSPLEMVTWSRPKYRKTQKTDSGVLYGVASVEVYGYEQIPPAVDLATAFPPLPV